MTTGLTIGSALEVYNDLMDQRCSGCCGQYIIIKEEGRETFAVVSKINSFTRSLRKCFGCSYYTPEQANRAVIARAITAFIQPLNAVSLKISSALDYLAPKFRDVPEFNTQRTQQAVTAAGKQVAQNINTSLAHAGLSVVTPPVSPPVSPTAAAHPQYAATDLIAVVPADTAAAGPASKEQPPQLPGTAE